MRELGYLYRKRFLDITSIAVTGTNGKSTTTAMLTYVFAQKFKVQREKSYIERATVASLGLRDDVQYLISEAAVGPPQASKFNAYILRPDIAVFTMIGTDHARNYPAASDPNATLEDLQNQIAEAKLELTTYLPPTGIVYINGDVKFFKNVKLKSAQKLRTYGLTKESDFYAEKVVFNDDYTTDITVCTEDKKIDIKLHVPGMHIVADALAAFAVAYDSGFSMEEIKSGLELYRPLPGRGGFITENLSVTIIDDTHNSSPESMKAAVDLLSSYNKGKRKVVIFGGCVGSGRFENECYKDIAERINHYDDIKLVVLTSDSKKVGYCSEGVAKFINPEKKVLILKDKDEICAKVQDIVQSDDVILVKGPQKENFADVVNKIKELFHKDDEVLKVRADCAAIFDIDNGRYVYEKNLLKKYNPGAIVKIVTALVVLENSALEDKVVLPENVTKNPAYVVGEEFTVKQLLLGTLVASSDVMSNILAVHIAGDIKSFVQKMNDFAARLGMKNSHFTDTHGHSADNISCIEDIVKLCRYAYNNKQFMEMSAVQNCDCSSPQKKHVFVSTNKTILKTNNLYNDNSLGGKTAVRAVTEGLHRIYHWSLVNFFRHDGHVYLTVQGDIVHTNPANDSALRTGNDIHNYPKFDEGLFTGADIMFVDALKMYRYIETGKLKPVAESQTDKAFVLEKNNTSPEEPFFRFVNSSFYLKS